MFSWRLVVDIILKNKLTILISVGLITLYMGYQARNVKLSHDFIQMLPKTDSASVFYHDFKKTFGEDGMVMFAGMEDDKIRDINCFKEWYKASESVSMLRGVNNVLSFARLYILQKDEKLRRFTVKPLLEKEPQSQAELDSVFNVIYGLKFYEGLLYNVEKTSTLMAMTIDKNVINSEERDELISEIQDIFRGFTEKTGVVIHFSGLPYIRTLTAQKVKRELVFFIFLAMIVAALALFMFFRSLKAVIFPMLIVCISVVWVLGLIELMGYKITVLSGIIPPLLIIIGVENCIYLLNKYHNEYILTGNKYKSLSLVIMRIGNALIMTNLTTAIGFSTFVITHNQLLVEFGIIASISIVVSFFLSIMLIPIIFSYFNPPESKQLKHLDNKIIGKFIDIIVFTVLKRRKIVFATAIILFAAGIYGVSLLTTTGRMVDDIPHSDALYKDLLFFEKNYKGVLPLEISVDTKKKHGLKLIQNIKKIDALQQVLSGYKELSHSLSLADLLKFARQSFYNGNPEMYSLPSNNELGFILRYIPDFEEKGTKFFNNFTDTLLQTTRISAQMANITTIEMAALGKKLKPQIDSIFDPEKYDVKLTGTSMIYLKGSTFLVHNLINSLIFAILLIAVLMALVFSSFRMIVVSLIPNLFPQLLTAAMMGYLGITIKPSTIIIFSIAFGISVDSSIHFLVKYKFELKSNFFKIKECVVLSLRETGVSMIYSSIVLFVGFAIFSASSFGGTQAMGYLISFTLLVALFSNLFILPSILLGWENRITTRDFYKKKSILTLEEEDTVSPEGNNAND